MFYSRGGIGQAGTESGAQAHCMLSVVRCHNESLGVVSDLCERDRLCLNTLGGSDTTHPAASVCTSKYKILPCYLKKLSMMWQDYEEEARVTEM